MFTVAVNNLRETYKQLIEIIRTICEDPFRFLQRIWRYFLGNRYQKWKIQNYTEPNYVSK